MTQKIDESPILVLLPADADDASAGAPSIRDAHAIRSCLEYLKEECRRAGFEVPTHLLELAEEHMAEIIDELGEDEPVPYAARSVSAN